jgi:hypothetical protein
VRVQEKELKRFSQIGSKNSFFAIIVALNVIYGQNKV